MLKLICRLSDLEAREGFLFWKSWLGLARFKEVVCPETMDVLIYERDDWQARVAWAISPEGSEALKAAKRRIAAHEMVEQLNNACNISKID